MARQKIHFFNEDNSYILKQKALVRHWISAVIQSEGRKLKELNFIFCSDDYLLKINQEFLSHNTYTDIITFDNSEKGDSIEGDIFISIDRIIENSSTLKVHLIDELHRVIVHGTLHLLGYKDKSKPAKTLMTLKEDQYLALRNF